MDDSFPNYCMGCDRLIAPPPLPEEKKLLGGNGGRKRAAGAIRIKNPDGSTTTRTANGVKTTRPPLRQGPRPPKAPGAQLGAQPPAVDAACSSSSGDSVPSRIPTAVDAAPSTTPPPAIEPFVSDIYCSRECAEKDAGSSSAAAYDLTRTFGNGFTTADAIVFASMRVSPPAPPSPLLGSDTDSSTSAAAALRGPRTPDAPCGSVPKTIEFFRLARDSADEAWRERHSSQSRLVDPTFQLKMARQRSNGPNSASGASSDSLASLWNGVEHDLAMKRSSSNAGSLHGMTPMHAPTPESLGTRSARRSMSSSSDGSGIQRPGLPRSALSHSSLGGLTSPVPNTFPPEVGSAPSHTAYLMQSYASAFPARDAGVMSPPTIAGTVTPDSRSASISIAPVPMRPSSGTIRASTRSRQGSTGATWDSFGKAEVRDRARRNTASSESEFGSLPLASSPDHLDGAHRARAGSHTESTTPRQSLEVDNSGWQIRYVNRDVDGHRRHRSSFNSDSGRSRSRSRDPLSSGSASPLTAPSTALPLPIPVRARPGPSNLASSTTSTARSRTPQTNGTPLASRGGSSAALQLSPNASRGASSAALPDLAALHIGAAVGSVSLAATALSATAATAASATTAAANTAVSREYASSPSRRSYNSPAGSLPRPGFDWDARTPHRTYELPKGVVQNPNKGLFYFNV